jgi:hypothetical protein
MDSDDEKKEEHGEREEQEAREEREERGASLDGFEWHVARTADFGMNPRSAGDPSHHTFDTDA